MENNFNSKIKLNNGTEIPRFGLGTWGVDNYECLVSGGSE